MPSPSDNALLVRRRLTQYGSGKQKYPLLDVLDYTLEYAKSSCERHREQNISADLRYLNHQSMNVAETGC